MSELSSGQRAFLRKRAHDLKPAVLVGKSGVTEQVLASVDQSLAAHELIKVKLLDAGEQRQELAEALARGTRSGLVGMIGNVAILYREQPDAARRVVRMTGIE